MYAVHKRKKERKKEEEKKKNFPNIYSTIT